MQNQILTGNSQKHNVTNLITAGNNVTSSIPQGDYIVQGTANIQLRAGNEITLNAGTTIQPNQGGIFSAVVEPFFTCTQFSMGKMVQTNGKSGERGF